MPSPLLLLSLLACDPNQDTRTYPEKVAGVPMAGAAESVVALPVGAPMGGYSSRCKILGSSSKQDRRHSQYALAFDRSTGIHTPPQVKVLWLDSEDDDFVLIHHDAIYVFDGMVTEVEQRLQEATGRDLDGKVVITASHSHAMPGNFSDDVHFYLGGDKFNREIYERTTQTIVDTALAAYESREEAAIGVNWNPDWDPDDLVYRDRRSDNDEVQMWDDLPAGKFKDPYGLVVRVEAVDDGAPIAMLVNFGMHGTLGGGDNPMWSRDSIGGLERSLEEQFDSPVVVMHIQGSGGDASAAGTDHGWARMESIGERAAPLLMAAWDATPVSGDAITTETASRHIPEGPGEIRVTRDGTVDWHYLPYEYREADGVLYNSDGSLEGSFDEWNYPTGGVFCGGDDPLIPGEFATDVFPYSSCVAVGDLAILIENTFELEEPMDLPIPASLEAGTTASLWEDVPQLLPDGSTETRPLLWGFFPAEPTAWYGEQYRRRVAAELGIELPIVVGYAQDHEGYFLIPEDWLLGGYEPNINVWGPLQGEHVMEGNLEMAEHVLLSPERENADPLGQFQPTWYAEKDMPTAQPDLTPDAGTRITEAPEYIWLPEGFELELEVPETCERVSCVVQMAWQGGDPGVDFPVVTLERQAEDGSWAPVTSHSGRPITSNMSDMLLGWTPDPLYPADAEQDHYWWVAWQAVGHVHDRTGIPEGSYRLVVEGDRYTGGDETWPWSAESYRVESEVFEVVPTTLSVALDGGVLSASVSSPAEGFRLVSLQGDSQGVSRISGQVELAWSTPEGDLVEEISLDLGGSEVTVPTGATALTVTDAYGNSGTLAL